METQTILKNGVIPTLCRMCDTRCALNVCLNDGVIVDISPFPDHPVNRGRMCPRGGAAIDVFYHPERILRPLKKQPDGSFEPVSRKQALDEISERMLSIKEKEAAGSVGVWKGEAVGFYQQEQYARRFIHAFGSPNYFSNDSVCFNGRYLGYYLVTGFWQPFPKFSESKLILLFGTNPPMCHPPFMREFADARQKGAKLVVIDPRLNPVACYSDIFAQPLPGTDGALIWGLIRFLIETKNYDGDIVERFSVGFEKIVSYAARFTPEYVEEQSGIFAHVVKNIGELIIKNRPYISIFPGSGLEHNENGVNATRALAVLSCLSGALGLGCGLNFPEESILPSLTLYDEIPLGDQKPIGADRFPVLYDVRKECHTMTAMDRMLGGGEYPLKGLIITGANPAVTNPNTRKVIRALNSLELLVVNDLFMTPTARLADYVLPAATFLERSEIHYFPKERLLNITPKIAAITGVEDEYTLWRDLARRLGLEKKYFPWADENEVNRYLLKPFGILPEKLLNFPEGYPLKPNKNLSSLFHRLPTPSGKVEFASLYLKERGLPELPEYTPPLHIRKPDERYPFILTTGARKSLFYHSRHQNIPRFRTVHPEPEAEIHTDDAKRLGIQDNDFIEVISEKGSIRIRARILHRTELRPGVIEIYHGWECCPVNILTFDDVNDPISGFPLLKGVPVRIEKADPYETDKTPETENP